MTHEINGDIDHQVLIGNDIGAINTVPNGTSGQVLTSNGSSTDPSWQDIPTPPSFTWNTTSSSQTLAANNGYICNGGAALSLLLPFVSSVGDILEITLDGAAGFQIRQNAGQTIKFGMFETTAGVGGSITSTSQGDSLRMVCSIANLRWVILSTMGNPLWV